MKSAFITGKHARLSFEVTYRRMDDPLEHSYGRMEQNRTRESSRAGDSPYWTRIKEDTERHRRE